MLRTSMNKDSNPVQSGWILASSKPCEFNTYSACLSFDYIEWYSNVWRRNVVKGDPIRGRITLRNLRMHTLSCKMRFFYFFITGIRLNRYTSPGLTCDFVSVDQLVSFTCPSLEMFRLLDQQTGRAFLASHFPPLSPQSAVGSIASAG